MKTLSTSMHGPVDLHLRSWKITTTAAPSRISTDAPQLTLQKSSSPMTVSSLSQQMPTSLPPSDTAPVVDASTSEAQLPTTPMRIPSRRASATPVRKVSASYDSKSPSSQPSANGDGTADREVSPWSAAVGRATAHGKSGRMIDKLMSDIDKLKRELNAEQQQRLEFERRDTVLLKRIDTLERENSNLIQAKETDAGIIRRRDRMIEELRGVLASEKAERIHAEEAASEAMKERNEKVVEALKAREEADRADVNAAILVQEQKALSEQYRQGVADVRGDLRQLAIDKKENNRRLDINAEQQQHEIDRLRKLGQQQALIFKQYQDTIEAEKIALADAARDDKEQFHRLMAESERHIGESRYYTNLVRLNIEAQTAASSDGESPEAPSTPALIARERCVLDGSLLTSHNSTKADAAESRI